MIVGEDHRPVTGSIHWGEAAFEHVARDALAGRHARGTVGCASALQHAQVGAVSAAATVIRAGWPMQHHLLLDRHRAAVLLDRGLISHLSARQPAV
ncbi:hypothetical protein [Variovorax sp. dw_954]|uniref:hypothetical protein n=1 Tax=Variovorax sp. dw_954 TaxID=2720078 RepID=UPI001BD26E96|nr:hypothetical protein [Variovorax sp. dw_954]